MIKINLLNVRERKKHIGILQEFIIYGMFFLLLISGIFYHLIVIHNEKVHIKKEISSIKERLEPLEKIAKKIEEFQEKRAFLKKELILLRNLNQIKRDLSVY